MPKLPDLEFLIQRTKESNRQKKKNRIIRSLKLATKKSRKVRSIALWKNKEKERRLEIKKIKREKEKIEKENEEMRAKLKRKSQKQEKDIAKKLGGKPVVASGAKWGAKGDVKLKWFLVEAKITQEDFYNLREDVWQKIQREANKDGMRLPLMIIDLEDGDDRLAVVNAKDFESYINIFDIDLIEGNNYKKIKYSEDIQLLGLSNSLLLIMPIKTFNTKRILLERDLENGFR